MLIIMQAPDWSKLREAIRSRVAIEDIVQQYVPDLKKKGSNYVALCPFHTEKTPSFYVSPQRQIFKCFGCGEGGDVVSFLMKIENISFWEAVKRLAKEAGIDISDFLNKQDSSGYKSDSRDYLIYNVLRVTLEYYEHNFWHNQNNPAYLYWSKRGYSDNTARLFRIGYASGDGYDLVTYLMEKRIPLELAQEAGVIKRVGSDWRDFMQNRLVFPILDERGMPLAFAGRTLEDTSTAKYINTPNSPVYNKSSHFFGIAQAQKAIRQFSKVYLTEGYFDVIALHDAGITGAIATCGTALTEDHVAYLKRFVKHVCLLFDSDIAGIQARMRAARLLARANLNITTVVLPADLKDPDEFLKSRGRDALVEYIQKHEKDFFLWFVEQFIADSKLAPFQREQYVREYMDIVSEFTNELLREEYIKLLACATQYAVSSLRKELNKLEKRKRKPVKGAAGEINLIKHDSKNSMCIEGVKKATVSILLGTLADWYKLDSDEQEKIKSIIRLMKELNTGLVPVEFLEELLELIEEMAETGYGEVEWNDRLWNVITRYIDPEEAVRMMPEEFFAQDIGKSGNKLSQQTIKESINQIQLNLEVIRLARELDKIKHSVKRVLEGSGQHMELELHELQTMIEAYNQRLRDLMEKAGIPLLSIK